MKQQNNIEFLAKQHADEKEALFILKKMRMYAERVRRFEGEYNKKKLEFWEAKADLLLRDLPISIGELNPRKNFKSLIDQLNEGLLYKKCS